MKSEIVYKHITFEEMLTEVVSEILGSNGGHIKQYFWEDCYGSLHEIVELDLFRGRFVTDNDDFSTFEWEIKKSRIYVKGDENEGLAIEPSQ